MYSVYIYVTAHCASKCAHRGCPNIKRGGGGGRPRKRGAPKAYYTLYFITIGLWIVANNLCLYLQASARCFHVLLTAAHCMLSYMYLCIIVLGSGGVGKGAHSRPSYPLPLPSFQPPRAFTFITCIIFVHCHHSCLFYSLVLIHSQHSPLSSL